MLNAKRGLDERIALLLRLCKGKRVLHLGCADWPYSRQRIAEGRLLHALLAGHCAELFGVDVSAPGLEALREAFPDLPVGLPREVPPGTRWEVIVAGEVIEHTSCPSAFLRDAGAFAVGGTELVLTTPNAYSLKGALRALIGREFQHPDHLVLFSAQTLTALLESCGWQVVAVDYYNARPNRRFAVLLGPLVDLAFSLVSNRARDGLVVRARWLEPSERISA